MPKEGDGGYAEDADSDARVGYSDSEDDDYGIDFPRQDGERRDHVEPRGF